MSDVLQVQGINSKGFGFIPKLVMQDRRLSAQAKAIYGYFASYAGAGRTAFPSLDKILADLDIGINSYYRHFNLLKKYGYIKAEQDKTEKGQFKRNMYTLASDVPLHQNSETEPLHHLPHTAEPYTDNSETNSNSLKNKQVLSKSNSQSVGAAPISARNADGRDETDGLEQKIIAYELLLRDNIDYDGLRASNPRDAALVDEIIAIMIDVLVTPGAYVALDGENKPRTLVRHNLMKLTREHIEHVLAQFNGLAGQVKKKRQYILTMLYNSALELDAHCTNMINGDMGGGAW